MCAHTMATAPKCKVCGAAHWAGQPHVFAKAVPAKAPGAPPLPPAPQRRAAPAPVVPDERDALIAELRARIAELEADAAATARRREANRERMRLKRARAPTA